MDLLTVLLVLCVIGVVVYLINRYVPMQPTMKSLLNGAAVVGSVLWLMKVFGVFTYLHTINVSR